MQYANMTREHLIRELQFLDPNGCWSDADCEVEGLAPIDWHDAYETVIRLQGPE